MKEKSLDIKFHIFNLEFQPYKEQSHQIGSFNIIKKCLDYINNERIANRRFIIIDRHEQRDKAESRKLFLSIASFSSPDKIFKCQIHLIRDKTPSFMDREKMRFESVDILKNKEIVETTNFFIDMNKILNPTVICEFNNLGPKISDIEYYLRFIASRKILHISKACKAQVHMEKSVEEVIESMKKVFKFRFKAKPENLPSLFRNIDDAFISNMQLLGKTVDPKSIKVDLSFRDSSGKELVSETNYKMIATSKKILNAVLNDIKVLEDIDDFYLEYEDDDGEDRDFSLIRGKVSLIIKCPLKDGKRGQLNTRLMYDLIKSEYQRYKSEKMTKHES